MSNKDHPNVIRFIGLFRKLQDMIDDDPDDLVALAKDDPSLRNLCIEVEGSTYTLRRSEETGREMFASPVSREFIEAWRRYEDAYSEPLSTIEIIEIFGADLGDQPTEPEIVQRKWDSATANASYEMKQIRRMLEFLEEQVEVLSDDLDEE